MVHQSILQISLIVDSTALDRLDMNNDLKTHYRIVSDNTGKITANAGNTLEAVNDFVYLGAWVESTEHDINGRKLKRGLPVIR